MDNKSDNGFKFTYSAREQAEVRSIREKYISKETGEKEDKLSRLRRLDSGVVQKATSVSLVFGIVGVLILGLGMSLAMSDLGGMLGMKSGLSMLFGVIIGIVGGILASLAYPVYNIITRHERAKIAPEIIRLTDELMK